MKCHFSVRIFFKHGSDGRNCVTKGRIFLCAFCFLCKSVLSFCEFNFGEDFFHQVIGITSRCQVCPKVFNVLLKHYFRRVCPQEPKSFFFNEAFFNACWVATVVVCVLKCFSRFVMCAHVENRFFLVVSNCETSAVNFMVGWYEFACSNISSLFITRKQNTS